MAKASELLKIAEAEIGYIEKETNAQLDDKTANAGDNNWTKYARDLHAAGYYQAPKNGYAWCDMGVDWCCLQLMGSKEKGEWLQCQTGLYGAGCEWSSNCYRWAGRWGTTPKVGAQIFFGKTGAESHTGIVEKYDDTYVYTIEFNTSNKVARRTYKLTDSYIVGYGYMRFDEEDVSEAPEAPQTPVSGKPSTGSEADEKAIWDFLKACGLNDYAVAGIMGNLYAESALRSNNLQQTYERKLGYTDDTYTAAVDGGKYDNFVKDSAGYGLAQWTYWSRKEALLKYAKDAGKSIGDLTTQLKFLWKELQGYKNVMNVLKTATTVKAASDVILTDFERPADMSDSVKTKRASYGQKYYDKFVKKEETPTSSAIKAGDVVKIKNGATYYDGKKVVPAWVIAKQWIVKSVGGDRVVVDKSTDGKNAICSPINVKYLTRVGSGASDAPTTPAKKSNEEIAKEVIRGLWGNGAARKQKLEAAGYSYRTVQDLVNEMLR